MRPPYREDQPPPVERVGGDGIVYVEKNTQGSWEDKQRGRSHPHSPQLLLGAWSFVISWLSAAALIASLVMLTLGHPDPWKELCPWFAGAMAVSLAAALLVSLTVKCPLCHGYPLHSRHGCHKHRLASRWFPLTHRATVVLRILTTFSFRCMYCGTPFRLFKRSSRQR